MIASARLFIIEANCILTFVDCGLKEEQVCEVFWSVGNCCAKEPLNFFYRNSDLLLRVRLRASMKNIELNIELKD
jgi:hypothetical protein